MDKARIKADNIKSVVVLIPALNEEATVGDLVKVASTVLGVKAIIVIDNGSRDATAAKAREAGAIVTSCLKRGKARAIRQGLSIITVSPLCDGLDAVVLLDADLRGLRAEHIYNLLNTLYAQDAVMSCGVLWNPAVFHMLRNIPLRVLTGQRAIDFKTLRSIDLSQSNGYELEATINCAVSAKNTIRVSLSGVTHVRREVKPYKDWAPLSFLPGYIIGPFTRLQMLVFYAGLLVSSAFASRAVPAYKAMRKHKYTLS